MSSQLLVLGGREILEVIQGKVYVKKKALSLAGLAQ